MAESSPARTGEPPANPTPGLSGEIHQPGEPDLKTLAEQINAEYDALKTALLSGAQRAIATGKLLLKAKALVRHGQWEEYQPVRACGATLHVIGQWRGVVGGKSAKSGGYDHDRRR